MVQAAVHNCSGNRWWLQPAYYLAEALQSKWMVVRKGSGSHPAKHLNTGWRSTEPVTCLHLRTPA